MKKTKKLILPNLPVAFFLLFSLLLLPQLIFPQVLWAATPAVQASSAILINASSGDVLYAKNEETLRPPASTTKIMTAILAIESGRLDQVVTVSNRAAAVGESSIGLEPGDRLTLRDLLHGALLKSGNDACVAIAEAIAPSEEEFVGLMNLKAKTLGAYNTTFYNTNGLPHSRHLTTASDLSLITCYAMQNKVFAEIVGKKSYTLHWVDSSRHLLVKNTNKLLWSYPPATGVKTGTTDRAGKCLVASAGEGKDQVIAVLLKSPNRFGEAQKLLEYGLNRK